MAKTEENDIIREFRDFIQDKSYPCVAARAAIVREQLPCMIASHMGCPADDQAILRFLYDFADHFRHATTEFHSAAVIFKAPVTLSEAVFDDLLWQRLQSLSVLDASNFDYDKRVSDDPSSSDFSFSLGEEAFFIIGLHPGSSRRSRQFKYPALVFNPHVQFENLRHKKLYENLKNIVRKRDLRYTGSINPMLADFGQSSEVYQYSGRRYDAQWECPLTKKHAGSKHHSTKK